MKKNTENRSFFKKIYDDHKIELFTLIASVLTGITISFLTQKFQSDAYYKQKEFDNQRIAYCKLMKLDITYGQAITNFYDNQITMNCHMVEYSRYSHSIKDSMEMERKKVIDLNNLNTMTSYQNELYETIGLVQTSFKMDKELQEAIDNVLSYRTINIPQFSQDFKNRDEFIAFKHILQNEAADNEAIIYTFLDNLIKVLQKRMGIEHFS